jgi:hypothetical protein
VGLLEKLTGTGRVLLVDAPVAGVGYEVRMYSSSHEHIHLTGDGVLPGFRRFECELTGLPKSMSSQARYALEMQDGRRLNFFVIDGGVQPTGGIY